MVEAGGAGDRSHARAESAVRRSADCRAGGRGGPDCADVPAYRGAATVLHQSGLHLNLPPINEADFGQLQPETRSSLHAACLFRLGDYAADSLAAPGNDAPVRN